MNPTLFFIYDYVICYYLIWYTIITFIEKYFRSQLLFKLSSLGNIHLNLLKIMKQMLKGFMEILIFFKGGGNRII